MLTKTAATVVSAVALLGTGAASVSKPLTAPNVVPCNPAALADAITNASDGETLSLDRFCVYQLTASLPPVEANLTIDGNGAVVERSPAPNTADFTMLGVDGDVTISNLSFRNASATGFGAAGAIENDGGLTITGGSFTGNTTTGFGGAIENDGTLTVTGVTFRNNVSADGGAVENLDVASISNSYFVGNSATFNGGALHNEGQVTITGSVYSGNSAAVTGGGLFDGIDGNAATITGTRFQQNQAIDGGAIYNEDVVSLTDTLLTGNHGTGRGGGVNTDWYFSAANSKITLNTAAGGGGGIYNGDFLGAPGSVGLSGSTVALNQPDNCEPAGTITGCGDPAAASRAAGVTDVAHARAARKLHLAELLARDFYPAAPGR